MTNTYVTDHSEMRCPNCQGTNLSVYSVVSDWTGKLKLSHRCNSCKYVSVGEYDQAYQVQSHQGPYEMAVMSRHNLTNYQHDANFVNAVNTVVDNTDSVQMVRGEVTELRSLVSALSAKLEKLESDPNELLRQKIRSFDLVSRIDTHRKQGTAIAGSVDLRTGLSLTDRLRTEGLPPSPISK